MDRTLDEFKYVNRVVTSCKTEEQLKHAKKWAENWARRQQRLWPDDVLSWTDLYLQVIEK